MTPFINTDLAPAQSIRMSPLKLPTCSPQGIEGLPIHDPSYFSGASLRRVLSSGAATVTAAAGIGGGTLCYVVLVSIVSYIH